MSSFQTLLLTIVTAGGVMFAFGVIYYLSNLLTNIYHIKLGIQQDVDKAMREFEDHLKHELDRMDKDIGQRANWIRDKMREEADAYRAEVGEHMRTRFAELDQRMVAVLAEIEAVQASINGLKYTVEQEMRAARQAKRSGAVGGGELLADARPEAGA